ncbi:DUF6515 family protein [Kosakonia sp.]|uniref:DUF6515 family protein n=1 Tax=Kosakonia sp. TaxID=1916651 RepID=UPI0028985EEE|nr:DUF6515 family protein [Kosakonia sp.]
MKLINKLAMAITLFAAGASTVLAQPGFHPHGGPGYPNGGHRDDIPRPGDRFSILPDIATTVLLGGLTYYLVNGIYYQRQGTQYVVVEKPSASPSPSGAQVLDFNGKRYYLRDGHYYARDIDGNYFEVPRPDGL